MAPMMDWTDRHERYFLRLISPRARLYTEMITSQAILKGDRGRLLKFNPEEHPVALQVGGAEPSDLAHCARIAEEWGYDEINLNVGCPSDRVQSGRFGACLMREPALVTDCLDAMNSAASLPVTVKCRLGVDEQDPRDVLFDFAGRIASVGIKTIIVHARKAWLEGLSPKENREVPPLDYAIVYDIKRAFPDLTVVINGGIEDAEACLSHLDHVDGVMLGRAAYQTPFTLAVVERALFSVPGPPPSRHEIVRSYLTYMERRISEGVPLKSMSRHILGVFHGVPGARAWRRHLSENCHLTDASADIVREALQFVQDSEDRTAA